MTPYRAYGGRMVSKKLTAQEVHDSLLVDALPKKAEHVEKSDEIYLELKAQNVLIRKGLAGTTYGLTLLVAAAAFWIALDAVGRIIERLT